MFQKLLPATDSAIDAVVFDWGGVLTDLPSVVIPKVMAEIGVRPLDPEERTAEGLEAFHRLERGEISLVDYLDFASRSNPGSERLWNPNDEHFVFRRLGQRRVVVESVMTLREAGYRTALLSNNVEEYWDGVLETLDVETLFDVVINSAHVGHRKPEIEIYELLLSQLDVVAERSVLLDDNKENIEGAVVAGMRAVHVTASDQDLFSDLHAVLGS